MQSLKHFIRSLLILSFISAQQFNGVDHIIEQAIASSVFPGATVIVGSSSEIYYHNSYGRFTYSQTSTVVDTNSIFDLASCTKVFATTSCIMKLVDSGLVDIDEYADTYIPAFGANGKDDIRIKDLLLHESGLTAYYSPPASKTPEEIIDVIFGMGQINPIGTYVYSCLNFVTLMKVVEAVAGKPMYQFFEEEFTTPLEMDRTMFAPPDSIWNQCPPTSSASGYQGQVHDPLARGLDGYSGNAGLFATTGDLAKICQLLLNDGIYKGVRYLDASIVNQFTTRYNTSGTSRALGWGTNTFGGTSAGSLLSTLSFGHTGYTGTSVWCDPVNDIFVVFLTNRVYPDDSASVTSTRQAVADAAFRALEGIPPQPILNSIKRDDADQLVIKWSPNMVMGPVENTSIWLDTGNGFQLYQTFGTDTTSLTIPMNDAPADDFIQVKLVNSYEGQNSDFSDTYSQRGTEKDLLIVDGYDRIGSWGAAAHHFSTIHGQALPDSIDFDSCDNDQVLSGTVNLNDYPYVAWILADESTSDETFSAAEQDIVEAYFKQGGCLLITGSEIGWDLGRSSRPTADQQFYNQFLRAYYVGDDAANTTINGVSGSIFDGISFTYGTSSALYLEDYPDYINAVNGSSVCLKYGNNYNAAVCYAGTFDGSTVPGKLVYFGFPFETIVGSSNRAAAMERIIGYFQQSTVGTEEDKPIRPEQFVLYQNYPNPFNPNTVITYYLSQDCQIDLSIYNLRGQKIETLENSFRPAGEHSIKWNGTNHASGIYFYRLTANKQVFQNQMLLIK